MQFVRVSFPLPELLPDLIYSFFVQGEVYPFLSKNNPSAIKFLLPPSIDVCSLFPWRIFIRYQIHFQKLDVKAYKSYHYLHQYAFFFLFILLTQ